MMNTAGTGNRVPMLRAASLLESKGFRNVVNLAGGYAAWRAAGNPKEPRDLDS